MDVSQLTDAELRDSLKSHGIIVGPIVSSTRKLYEKKLAKAVGDQSANDSQLTNGTIDHQETAEASFSPIFKNVKPASPKQESKVTRRSVARSQQQQQSSSTREPEPESDDECEESMRYLTEEEMAADRAAMQRSYTSNSSSPFKVTKGSIVFWAFVVLAITFLFFSVDNYVYKFIEEAAQKAKLRPDDDPI